jgi:hypothetical protein
MAFGASTALEGAHVIKSSPGTLTSIFVAAGAGYLMVFNATSVPADGSVAPVICIATSSGFAVCEFDEYPAYFSTGIVAVYSTTGPFTKTEGSNACFNWNVV